MTTMYHSTSIKNIESIFKNGLSIGSYITVIEALAEYYAETIEDDGDEAVILTFDSEHIKNLILNPDHIGLEEPINTVLKENFENYDKNTLWSDWLDSNQDGNASIELIGSARIGVIIEPKYLSIF